jgi:uncharacterized FAD-dependent dehydrogenase
MPLSLPAFKLNYVEFDCEVFMDYQAIIVGAGPAGIFSALTLADQGIKPILLLELGKDLSERKRRQSNDMLCGWGGAGAYSDGKLTL